MCGNTLDRTCEAQLIIINTNSYIIAEINADLENFAETSLTPENPIKLKFYFGFFPWIHFIKWIYKRKNYKMQKFIKIPFIHFFFSKESSHKNVLCSFVLMVFQFIGMGRRQYVPSPPKSEKLVEKTGYLPKVYVWNPRNISFHFGKCQFYMESFIKILSFLVQKAIFSKMGSAPWHL